MCTILLHASCLKVQVIKFLCIGACTDCGGDIFHYDIFALGRADIDTTHC